MNSPPPWLRSPGIEQVTHDLLLWQTKEKTTTRPSRLNPSLELVVLTLHIKCHNLYLKLNPKGLVGVLPDPLLASLGIAYPTMQRGRHERQEHA